MRKHESHHHSPSDASTHTADTHSHTHRTIDPVLLWQFLLEEDLDAVLDRLQSLLRDRFGIDHVTL